MKHILNERQEFWKTLIRERLMGELLELDNIEQCHIEEVINAIALGCCLQKPRTFGKEMMTSEDFRELARVATFETICIPAQALAREKEKGREIRNRIWYIMGVFASIGPQPQSHKRQSDHKERIYSSDELKSIVRSIGTFSVADL